MLESSGTFATLQEKSQPKHWWTNAPSVLDGRKKIWLWFSPLVKTTSLKIFDWSRGSHVPRPGTAGTSKNLKQSTLRFYRKATGALPRQLAVEVAD